MTPRGAFITDLGKVLIDYDWNILLRLLNRAYEPLDEFRARFSKLAGRELREQFGRGKINSCRFYSVCCSALGVDLSFDRFVAHFNCVFTGEIAGVTQLLPQLKKEFGTMVMITNTNDLHFRFVKQRLPHIFKFFDLVLASHEVGLLKPERGIYDLAIKFIESRGTRAENSLFVDDLQRNLDGAKIAGIGHTFLFCPGKEIEFRNYLRNVWRVDC